MRVRRAEPYDDPGEPGRGAMTASRNLRGLLVASLVVANLAVLAIAGYSIHDSRKGHELRAETLTQNIASALVQSISYSMDRIHQALHTVADEFERQLSDNGIDAPAMQAFLDRHAKRLPEVVAFRVLNADGDLIFGKDPGETKTVNWADRDYFIYHRDHADDTLRMTKPFMGLITREYIVAFSQRLSTADGRFAGVLIVPVTVDHFTDLMSKFDLGPGGTIALRDGRDIGLITRYPAIPDKPAGQVGDRSVSQTLRQLLESGVRAATFHTTVAADGVERIATFHRLEKAPMIVVAGLARDSYLAEWSREAYTTSAMAFGFLLLSLFSGRYMLRLLNQTMRASHRNQIYLQNASDGIQILDAKGNLVEANDRFCTMLGHDRAELLGKNMTEWCGTWTRDVLEKETLPRLLASSAPATMETRLRRKDGTLLDVEANVSSFGLDGSKYLYASVRDITERKEAIERIEHLAFYDPLTDLPNRRLLLDRLERALSASARHQRQGALMLLDMDDFKTLNDTLGHDVGDRFLVEVANRLTSCVRDGDTVARHGGDEFVVILEDLTEDTLAAMQVEVVAEKILRRVSEPYLLDLAISEDRPSSHSYHCTSSIGITLFRDHSVSVDELMKRVDTAMYQAKAAGRNALRFFEPEMQAVVAARAALDNDLREAVEENQFRLYYQPQVDAAGIRTGVEALLRWQHPRRGFVSPSEFIPQAEASGLILPLGEWVLETACAQLAGWSADPVMARLGVAVNISARQFRQPAFVDQVLEIIDRTGADPNKLKLELTESLLLDDVEDIIAKMITLHAEGIRFSLDDFGTGYSSLAYLKRLPLDQLKIDQSFVRDVLTDPNDAAIARTVVALAQSMGLEVIAEGVENEAQREFLAASGCYAYQGYLFGRPMPAEELAASASGSAQA